MVSHISVALGNAEWIKSVANRDPREVLIIAGQVRSLISTGFSTVGKVLCLGVSDDFRHETVKPTSRKQQRPIVQSKLTDL